MTLIPCNPLPGALVGLVVLLAATPMPADAAVIELLTIDNAVDANFRYPWEPRKRYVVVTPGQTARFRAVMNPIPGQPTAQLTANSSVPHLLTTFTMTRNNVSGRTTVTRNVPIGTHNTSDEIPIRLQLDSPLVMGYRHQQRELNVLYAPKPRPTAAPSWLRARFEEGTRGWPNQLRLNPFCAPASDATYHEFHVRHADSGYERVETTRSNSTWVQLATGGPGMEIGDLLQISARGCNARGCGPWIRESFPIPRSVE